MEQPFIELDRFMRILIVKVSGQILNTRIPIKLVRSYDIFFIKLHRPLAAVSNERHEDIRQFRVIASCTRKLQQIEGAIGIDTQGIGTQRVGVQRVGRTGCGAQRIGALNSSPSLIARSYNSRALAGPSSRSKSANFVQVNPPAPASTAAA